MKFNLLAALILIGHISFAHGDTMWFDAGWQLTASSQAVFYRPQPVPSGQGFYIRDYYINGTPQGEGWSYTPNGDGWDGPVKYYRPDGKLLSIASYKNKVADGTWVEFLPSGDTLGRAGFKNGKLDGEWLRYFSKGKPESRRFFKDGLQDGPDETYSEAGFLMITDTYQHGMATGTHRAYYRSGKVCEEGFYTDGIPSGIWKFYDEQGKILKQFPSGYAARLDTYRKKDLHMPAISDMLPDGEYQLMYASGKVRWSGTIKDHKQEGQWKYYDERGTLRVEEYYTAGLRDASERYYDSLGRVRIWATLSEGKLDGRIYDFDYAGSRPVEYYFVKGIELSSESEYESASSMYFGAAPVVGSRDPPADQADAPAAASSAPSPAPVAAAAPADGPTRAPGRRPSRAVYIDADFEEYHHYPRRDANSLPLDTVSAGRSGVTVTATVPRKERDKRMPEITGLKITVSTLRSVDSLAAWRRRCRPGDNEVILFYKESNRYSTTPPKMEFCIGRNILNALRSKQMDTEELADVIRERVIADNDFNRIIAIFNLGKAIYR